MKTCKHCLNHLYAYKNALLKQLWFGHKDNYEDRIDILKAFNEPIENNFCCETCEGSYNHYILGNKEDKKLKQQLNSLTIQGGK